MRIGHASISENNTVNGQKGDQTTKEVCIREWYSKPWNILLRPKDFNKAEIMAQSCEKGCTNNNIGYSQSTRNTLRQEAIKVNFDLSKVGLCNCDCSSFMAVCAESAGIAIPYNYGNAPTTSTMKNAFLSTGEFDLYTDLIYLNSTNLLKRGDILVKEGSHTVMVLDDGNLINNTILTPNNFAIDISENQKNIDFVKLKENNISKIILRSTTKNYHADNKWYEYLDGCDKYNIPVECYKYSYAVTTEQAIAEANSVIQLLNGRKMFIWLDLENKNQRDLIQKQGITLIANTFITTCQNAGYEVGIYCNLDWYKNYIDNSFKNKYKFWIARYPKNDTGEIKIELKPNVGEVMWQYTSKGKILGINGNVDVNAIYDSTKPIQSQNDTFTCVTKDVKINNTVNASSLNVRSQPTQIAPIKYKLNRNEKVNIYGYITGWYSISKTLDEWVSADYILTTKGIITATKLNYRTDAGTNFTSLGQYTNGEVVNILNEKKDNNGKIWYLCVNIRNDKFGWASSEYISKI